MNTGFDRPGSMNAHRGNDRGRTMHLALSILDADFACLGETDRSSRRRGNRPYPYRWDGWAFCPEYLDWDVGSPFTTARDSSSPGSAPDTGTISLQP